MRIAERTSLMAYGDFMDWEAAFLQGMACSCLLCKVWSLRVV